MRDRADRRGGGALRRMLGEPALARLVAVIPRPVRTAFRHIRRLNERGLICLSSSAVDRRITIVTLTEQGEELREMLFREERA